MSKGYVDSDGHVIESERELREFIEEPFASARNLTMRRMLPSLDRFHTVTTSRDLSDNGTFDLNINPDKWLEFLDKTGLEYTVLSRNSIHLSGPTVRSKVPSPVGPLSLGV